MTNSKGMYAGRPLEDHSKDELIDIVLEMGRLQHGQREQAARDRDILLGMVGRQRAAPSWKVSGLFFISMALTFVLIGLALRFFLVRGS